MSLLAKLRSTQDTGGITELFSELHLLSLNDLHKPTTYQDAMRNLLENQRTQPAKLTIFQTFESLGQLEQSTIRKIEKDKFENKLKKQKCLYRVHHLALYDILVDRKPPQYLFCPLGNTSKSAVAAALRRTTGVVSEHAAPAEEFSDDDSFLGDDRMYKLKMRK